MTFSVSKLETQLGLWFASVLCHVLVYAQTGLRNDAVHHDYIAKDPVSWAHREKQSLDLADLWRRGTVGFRAASWAGQGLGKGEGLQPHQWETQVRYKCTGRLFL